MLNFYIIGEKFKLFYGYICVTTLFLIKLSYIFCTTIYNFLVHQLTHFWIELFYFIFISCIGFLVLSAYNKPRNYPSKPKAIDMFFTSVSATTVSSMSTIEMEVFSNTQLFILTILMFIGGEVFTSMVGLHFMSYKLRYTPQNKARSRVNSLASLPLPIETHNFDQVELGSLTRAESVYTDIIIPMEKSVSEIDFLLKSKAIRVLGFVVLVYLLVVHVLGILMVVIYFKVTSDAENVLEKKGLKTLTFSIFTVVSTFASCGFVPTNENMIVFRQNSGLLLMLIPQILLGNTLFPSFLRLSVWVLSKFVRKSETRYLLRNTKEIQYLHWLPAKHAKLLVVTVFGLVLVQFMLFVSLDWKLEGLRDLNVYEKIVGILFQCVNSRHTGESIVDLSTITSAILVVFALMMYFPPYTSFLPTKDEEEDQQIHLLNNNKEKINRKNNKINLENIIFSQLSYLVIFITIICIIEREKMKDDPLNFNVFNIVIEVISANGNVGFSTGYSCGRQVKHDATCVDKWYGFVGKWNNQSKFVLIIVMFFGRLKKFNMRGGQAWKLL